MTMFMCHCGEVHDSAVQGDCVAFAVPETMEYTTDDDREALCTARAILKQNIADARRRFGRGVIINPCVPRAIKIIDKLLSRGGVK